MGSKIDSRDLRKMVNGICTTGNFGRAVAIGLCILTGVGSLQAQKSTAPKDDLVFLNCTVQSTGSPPDQQILEVVFSQTSQGVSVARNKAVHATITDTEPAFYGDFKLYPDSIPN
jgi:hypothetical protein